ncbi:hypothetical protein [Pseudactinotalea sp. Z1748]|uniref:hypothetical protein n=1 Tax=Pseudactinotalea sp. Z1748 TaxID=3413027 RepID=UPI003C7CB4BE
MGVPLVAALAVALVVISFQVRTLPAIMGAGLTFEESVPALVEPWLELAAELALLIGLPMLLGAFLGQRRALVATLRERARRAEEEQRDEPAESNSTRFVLARMRSTRSPGHVC